MSIGSTLPSREALTIQARERDLRQSRLAAMAARQGIGSMASGGANPTLTASQLPLACGQPH